MKISEAYYPFGHMLKMGKPKRLTWKEYLFLLYQKVRYQPLLFPDGKVIEKKSSRTVIDSRAKMDVLGLPGNMSGKTFLDIGCAEGFFVIQAVLRDAEYARGIDISENRLRIARIISKAWGVHNKSEFKNASLYDLDPSWAADIVTCLAVCHHQHKENRHIWEVLSDRKNNEEAYRNMLRAVKAIAALTKEVTYLEYSFEYRNGRPADVDYEMLARIWEKEGIYGRVDFIGLSQWTQRKDRAIYHAYK